MTRSLAAIDRWFLIYVIVATVALLRQLDGMAYGATLLVAHGLLLTVPFLAARSRVAGPFGHLIGTWYPLILLLSLYTDIGLINLAGGRVFDETVQAWEASLFGMQPSRDWIRAQPWPWLSWPLHIGYLSYYAIVVGAPLALWLSRRRVEAAHTILLAMVTFFLCYAVFLFFPVAGPRYAFALADNAATDVAPAIWTQHILNAADSWGAAFPSSHVAAALVVSLAATRHWPLIGFALIPLAVLLTLGTVYGQFHYAVDAIAGTALAGTVITFGFRSKRRTPPSP